MANSTNYNHNLSTDTAWGIAAMDLLPYQDWTDFDLIQPRTHIFEGGGIWNTLLLVITTILLIHIFFITKRLPARCNSSRFVLILTIPIAMNILPRYIKNIYLLVNPWPNAFFLYVLTTIELTLYLVSHLNFIGSLFLYLLVLNVKLVKEEGTVSWKPFVIILLISTITSLLYFNLNKVLQQFPFFFFFILLWIYNVLNFFLIVIATPASLVVYSKKGATEAKTDLIWMYPFILVAILPHSYSTFLTLYDLFFEMFKSYTNNPGQYVDAIRNRLLAFSLQPLFLFVAILIMMPSYRNNLLFFLQPRNSSSVRIKPVKASDIKKEKVIVVNQPAVAVNSELVSKKSNSIVTAGGLSNLDPLLFPGAAPSDPNKTVIPGGLHRLDPSIYPGASVKPVTPEQHVSITVIFTPKNAQTTIVAPQS